MRFILPRNLPPKGEITRATKRGNITISNLFSHYLQAEIDNHKWINRIWTLKYNRMLVSSTDHLRTKNKHQESALTGITNSQRVDTTVQNTFTKERGATIGHRKFAVRTSVLIQVFRKLNCFNF